MYRVYSKENGRTVLRTSRTIQEAILFMSLYDPDGEVPFLIRDSRDRSVLIGEEMLSPVRSNHAYTVQVQHEIGWIPYIHTDDVEDALYTMEEVANVNRCPARVIENNEEGNVLDEQYPFFNDEIEIQALDFDWRKDGF